MKNIKLQRDVAVALSGWAGGILLFLGVTFAPTTLRATVVGTAAVAGGAVATNRYLARPRRTHPVVFNNGELKVEAVIVNSPYDEFETQRRVAGIAHTLVACVSRPKHLPREASQALKSINDEPITAKRRDSDSQTPIVINVTGSAERPVQFEPEFSFVDEDGLDAMDAEELDEDDVVASGECTACDNDAEVLLEWENDDGQPVKYAYCHNCAEVVRSACETVG